MSLCLSIYLSVCLCLSIYLSICLSVCLYVSLSIYISVCLSLCLSIYSPCGPRPLFQFLNLRQSVGLLGRGISPSQGRYLNTEQHKQNEHTLISMPRVRFEPTIPVFERAKTVHALDRAAIVISLEN
jgi:hypothetical protein